MDSLDLPGPAAEATTGTPAATGVARHRDRTWGSAPAASAARAARRPGLVVGSVSGSCVGDDLIERVRHGERVDRPSLS